MAGPLKVDKASTKAPFDINPLLLSQCDFRIKLLLSSNSSKLERKVKQLYGRIHTRKTTRRKV